VSASIVAASMLAVVGCAGGDGDRVALDSVVAGCQEDFTVRGAETEPTFIERFVYGRMGDLFALDATSSIGEFGRIVVRIGSDGTVAAVTCPAGTDCGGPWTTGFLSTVAVLSVYRQGRLDGDGLSMRFAGRDVVCVPAEMLGAADPPLDPCFDRNTGAVVAHRHRSDGSFDGPTPDPESLTIAARAEHQLFAGATQAKGDIQ
jgi:hypothetical protein